MTAAPPDGFAPHFRHSPLTDPWEPLYSRRDGDDFILAVSVRAAHTNARGFAHGGLITALADNAMGIACVLGTAGLTGIVTVNLSVDFIGIAKLDDWLEIRATPVRVGRTIAFAECRITVGDRLIARGSAVFSVPAPAPAPPPIG